MKKSFLYFCLATVAFLNFSCDDDKEADEVVPEMELTMKRIFMYHDTHESKTATYTTSNLQSSFSEDEKLSFYVGSGEDGIAFEIADADLAGGYVGSYNLKSLPNPGNGKAKTTYTYSAKGTSGSAYFSQANYMSGAVEITDYNEKHHLISGTFELTMEDVPDPTITSPTSNPRRSDVTITGTFENVKLTSNP